ncbi:flagellar assembly protein H [bacterium YEK0313]|nr:flagellar assembly protein H [bacterium YEK0313]
MAKPVKFLFDTEFAAEAKQQAEPRVTLAEHQALVALARQESHATGLVTGEAQAMASLERQRALALTAIGDRLSVAAEALKGLEARLEQEAIDIAVAVASKLASTLIAREPLAEIRTLVADCFANLRSVPHLVVRVHDDLLDDARTELGRLATERGFDGRLVILAEPTIAPGDCRIEWSHGGMVLDRAQTTSEITEAVQRYLGVAAPAALEDTP